MWRQSSALRLSCSRSKSPGDCACPAIGELFDLAIQLLSQRAANVAAWQASDGTVGAKSNIRDGACETFAAKRA
jgi:hypothetical protein